MPRVLMEGITKYYEASGVLANDGAGLLAEGGEIHALVGENGAGKSTLMKVLYGLERPDGGRIELDGRPVAPANAAEALALGIGMVQQHAELVDEFSVAENVTLCAEPRRFGLALDRRGARARVAALCGANGFSLDPDAPCSSLSVGQRQELEILKLLHRDAGVLVLDEPTAALADEEVDGLFASLRRLAAAGRSVIIITHKIREVLAVADSVTVMRHGRTVARLGLRGPGAARLPASAEAAERLSSLMMGGEAPPPLPDMEVMPGSPRRAPAKAQGGSGGEASPSRGPVLVAQDLRWAKRRGARPAVDGVALSVRPGEILGICAVAGNGLSELEALVTGSLKPSAGSVTLHGKALPRRRGPAIGYVPEDRMRKGASLHSSIDENLSALDRRRFFPRNLRDGQAIESFAAAAIARFGIAARPGQRLGSLSGGNIQKAILARELSGGADFLVFSNPTWGLDLASTAFVHERILEARNRGAAILLLTPNLDEALALSDRVAAMSRGRIALELPNDGTVDGAGSRRALGRAMLGLAEAPR